MNVKETVLLALKLARKERRDLVVGHAEGSWHIMPLADSRSDQLEHSLIITPKGLRYPDDADRLADLVSQGM